MSFWNLTHFTVRPLLLVIGLLLLGLGGPPHIAMAPLYLGYNHGVDAEARHRSCWYARRTAELPEDLGSHTIIDGELVYCAHPMYWPVVRYEFDLSNCADCDVFKARRQRDAEPKD
jgi:hypothetical protein